MTGYEGTSLPSSAPTPLPTPLPTSSSTSGVAHSGYQTLHVVDDSGGLWYAGYGYAGRLGSGANSNSGIYTLTRMAGVNNVVKMVQGGSCGIVLTGDGTVWYWPPTSTTYTVTEMPIGSFLGDDDDSAGATYGLEGTTGQATDVAGGLWTSNGYQTWCAVVDFVKVRER